MYQYTNLALSLSKNQWSGSIVLNAPWMDFMKGQWTSTFLAMHIRTRLVTGSKYQCLKARYYTGKLCTCSHTWVLRGVPGHRKLTACIFITSRLCTAWTALDLALWQPVSPRDRLFPNQLLGHQLLWVWASGRRVRQLAVRAVSAVPSATLRQISTVNRRRSRRCRDRIRRPRPRPRPRLQPAGGGGENSRPGAAALGSPPGWAGTDCRPPRGHC